MKILLLGKNGQVGWELQRQLATLGDVVALGSETLDLREVDRIRSAVREIEPQLIVNAAAYTAVDRAESDRESAMTVNGITPRVLAQEAGRIGAGFVHFSTDQVFNGKGTRPYAEDDEPDPVNVYGASKLAGELGIREADTSALILRLSWVYSLRRESFVSKVIRWAESQQELRIVNDQVSTPTWCESIAKATARVIDLCLESGEFLLNCQGLYHLASSGQATRFEWAMEILRAASNGSIRTDRELTPARSEEFPTAARRPQYTVLDCSKLERRFGIRLPDWRDDLRRAWTDQSIRMAE